MNQLSVESALADLNLSAIHFFPGIDSTNDEAWRWVDSGAPDVALVIADMQTAGRGRYQRHWVTSRGAGLAFSLILQSPPFNPRYINQLNGLGALAICDVLRTKYLLPSQIKWPNDVLLNLRKVAGVLVEARWNGASLQAVVIGIGINIAPESISPTILPPHELSFPATSVEAILGHSLDRLELLHAILKEFLFWLPQLSSPEFIHAWEANLAYHNQEVELSKVNVAQSSPSQDASPLNQVGKLIGLAPDGSLKLLTDSDQLITVQVGEVHLRPAHAGSPRPLPD